MTEPDLAISTNNNEVKAVSRRPSIVGTVLAFAILLGFLTILALGLRRSQQGPIALKQTVPAFSITDFTGKTYNTADYKGKVILINFWASWCQPCATEAAELQEAWLNYESTGKVLFLGIDYVDTEPEALAYLNQFKITYPNGPDLGTRISQMFRMGGVPETYIVDRNGKLVHKEIGPFESTAQIISIIDPLLK
jgi:cytochrome c biogenesis protein CcmG, thiol:disulfide interchange protein DsbE